MFTPSATYLILRNPFVQVVYRRIDSDSDGFRGIESHPTTTVDILRYDALIVPGSVNDVGLG